MEEDRLLIELEGRGDAVSFAAFLRVAQNALAILRGLDGAVSGRDDRIDWQIKRASLQSPLQMEILGESASAPGRVPLVLTTYLTGLRQLDERALAPGDFSDQMLQHAKDLVGALNHGIVRIAFSSHGIVAKPTQRVAANVDEITRPVKDRSTLEGLLQGVMAHDGMTVYVYDVLSGDRVKCVCPEALRDEIKEALFERVAVEGEVTFTREGRPISISVDAVTTLPPALDLPQFFEVPPMNITGGIDPADYVEELHDDF